MGHHGWQGNPPRTEVEARERIVAAAATCLEKFGPAKTTLSDVASELGVTRQTVYRYYANLAELLGAVAQAGLEDFVDRMQRHLSTFTTPSDVAIESIVFAVQAIPRERRIGALFQAGETEIFSRDVTSSMAVAVGADILRRVPVDWSEIGVAADELDGLAEILMRLFVSFLQHPADPPRSADELRALVRRWLGPALAPSRSLDESQGHPRAPLDG
ncbi:TetR/AcrR family transcriptional regulator [Nocardioides bizhenqiangii]|uniref:TetR/AcrR family transcriptional regulator n=1 Tax=Nocardioides bizhenqiangii TaxID=3095076 RepID=A0ABZ0ZTJ3_9ACTN|nr:MULTISPECIES: TetR/AcrR family transcriptional regulator [unclassified Nocardioides]MDZ5621720.1 TetR/AcrR family transcriptional regulator [Nocardioides sp. HM23]WQQ27594.1 TetR/AcrR family transcriptional regulator [Nocardioides sp. HM61]